MGLRKSGFVRNEQGDWVSGQSMVQANPPTAWSDERVDDYRRWREILRRRMALETAAATPVPDDNDADLDTNVMNLRRRIVG